MAQSADSPFRNLLQSWPALVTLGVALWGVLLARPNLDSDRPTPTEAIPAPPLRTSQASARLWQDPFAAVWSQVDTATLIAKPLPTPLFKPLSDEQPPAPPPGDANAGKALLVLCSFLDSDNTAEIVESRRRERYATIAALSTAGYVPASSETLSYFHVTKEQPDVNPSILDWFRLNPPVGGVLPFEWFIPATGLGSGARPTPVVGYRAVCVLWVPTSLRPSDQSDLLDAFCFVRKQLDAAFPAASPRVAFSGRLLSTRVNQLLTADEDSRKQPGKVGQAKSRPSVTADCLGQEKLYLTYSTAPFVRGRSFAFTKLTPEFLIGSDDRLADVLVREFGRRGLSPGTQECRIAIIAESDSTYGRGFAALLATAIPAPPGAAAGTGRHIDSYAYLRGLDGKLPMEVRPDEADSKSKGTGDHSSERAAPANAPTAQQAQGDSQTDYLRRLVERMKYDENEGKKFKVIGVVGTDFYDKLLVLKALRASFPDALVFTTDLDSRLLQPGDYQYTHNLLIASHYGLMVRPELQLGNPPFRSGYDTATYLAVLKALGFAGVGGLNCTADGQPRFNGQAIEPRLFEVGRNGAYELTMGDDGIHPRSLRLTPWIARDYHWAWLLGLGAVLGLVLAALSRPCRAFVDSICRKPLRWLVALPFRLIPARWSPPGGKSWLSRLRDWACKPVCWGEGLYLHLWALAWCVLVVFLLILLYWAHTSSEEQPVELFEGISVWPTECLRLAAVGVALAYLLTARRDLLAGNQQIREDLEMPPRTPSAKGLAAAGAEAVRGAFRLWWWKPQSRALSDVWEEAERFGTFAQRALRCLALLVLCAILVFFLWRIFDPVLLQPRGLLARWTDGALMTLSGVALVGLMLVVYDATVLCHRFVSYLSRPDIDWPPKVLEKQAELRGLPVNSNSPDAGSNKEALRQWLLVRLAARAADVVARSIYYPFVVLVMLMLAQNRIFADWHWNIPFMTVALLTAGGTLACAVLLQRSARRVRDRAQGVLDDLIRKRIGIPEDEIRPRYEQIRTEIENMQSGAFAGLATNPIVVAVLLPLAGGGGLAALQALLPYF
jgi:hypothetical protein